MSFWVFRTYVLTDNPFYSFLHVLQTPSISLGTALCQLLSAFLDVPSYAHLQDVFGRKRWRDVKKQNIRNGKWFQYHSSEEKLGKVLSPMMGSIVIGEWNIAVDELLWDK